MLSDIIRRSQTSFFMSKNYDGPLYAPWSKVVEGRGFDPVEERSKNKNKKGKISNESVTPRD